MPKVLRLDVDGRPIAGHETVTKNKDQTVESIPWNIWFEKEIEPNDGNLFRKASTLFWMAHDSVHSSWDTACPITIVRKNNSAYVVALDDIRARELVVPLFVKRSASVVAEDDRILHPHSIPVTASWSKTTRRRKKTMKGKLIRTTSRRTRRRKTKK